MRVNGRSCAYNPWMGQGAAATILILLAGCAGEPPGSPSGRAGLAINVDSGDVLEESTGGSGDPVQLGWVTASAGDVDGDGFDDLLVTSVKEGSTSHGQVLVFLGGFDGFDASTGPDWVYEGQDDGELGFDAAGVGDINNDLFDDIAVGEPGFGPANEGRVLFFLGGGALSPSPDRTYEGSTLPTARTGTSVVGVGDLDGDGFDDFVVGEPGVGNLSGDPNAGQLLVFHGSAVLPTQLVPGPPIVGTEAEQGLGTLLAALGDVNADGHPDLLAANQAWATAAGRVELYLGDGSGLQGAPIQVVEGTAWADRLGAAIVGAGDIDGDGYADAAVGSPGYRNGPDPVGRVLFLTGSDNPSTPLFTLGSLEGDTATDKLGYGASLGALGDVNGDGYADLFVSREGAAVPPQNYAEIVYSDPLGGSIQQEFGGCAFSEARGAGVDGDGDGFPELIVGAMNWAFTCMPAEPPGRVERFIGHGEGLRSAGVADWDGYEGTSIGDAFGTSLGAIDFNGDGYDDLVVGAPYAGSNDGGEAGLYLGGPPGVDTVVDVVLQGPVNIPGDEYGWAVAGAGDVNGDGYGDVIVGAPGIATPLAGGMAGQAFLFLGSPTPPSAAMPSGAPLEGSFSGDELGRAVAGAGDVDGDGFDEVVVASPGRDGSKGRVQVCSWDATLLELGCDWFVNGWTVGDEMGISVSSGDINGDGYSDVIVGVPGKDFTIFGDHGQVEVHQGGPGFETASSPATVSVDGGVLGARMGQAVAYVGDVNGDLFGDILVSEPEFASGQTEEGRITLLRGAGSMPIISPLWQMEGGIVQRNLAGAMTGGDFNGDGLSDIVFSSPQATGQGDAVVGYGLPASSGLGEDWTFNGLGGTGDSLVVGDFNGDGFDDLFVGSPGAGNGQVHGFPGNRGDFGAQEPRPMMLRVLQMDGTPIPPGGHVDGPEVQVEILARSPVGRTGATLQVELQPYPLPLTGLATNSSGVVEIDNLGPVPPLSIVVPGIAPNTAYRVQARLQYDRGSQPVQRTSRWLVPGGPRHVNVVHFRRAPGPTGDDDDTFFPDDDDTTPADDDDIGPDDDDIGPDDDDSTPVDDDDTAPDDDDIGPDDDDTAPDDDDTDPDDDDSTPVDDDDTGPDDDDTAPDDDDSADPGTDDDGDGWTVEAGDCNDNNPGVHPGASESCNSIDDDCDGFVDDGVALDFDGDGVGGCIDPPDCAPYDSTVYPGALDLCDGVDSGCDGLGDEIDADGDGVLLCAGDCDDDPATGADRFPGNPEACGDGVDQDCNGSDSDSDDDNDGYAACADGDCNDGDAAVHPGAAEICDGLDDDCDGQLGPGENDDDGDGWPNCNDCNPVNPSIHPLAEETCNGFDDDCDGFSLAGGELDRDGDGFFPCNGDCDDQDASVNLWQAEDCSDGVDNNCDGAVDEDLDIDGDGQTTCEGDCRDDQAAINSLNAVEICDTLDNDCSGVADDGQDLDGDGHGVCDCDDNNASVSPGAYEFCGDGLDNDCDPFTDEDNDVDHDGDGYYICLPPAGDCRDGNLLIHPGAREVCDGVDNNCDAVVDETYDADSDEWLTCRFDCDDDETPINPDGVEVCHNGIDEDCDGDPDELCPDPVRVIVPPGHACSSCEGGAAFVWLPLLAFGRRRRRS